MRYFVTGGAGFVGRHLILRLLADGHTVRALAADAEEAAVVESLGATPVPAGPHEVDRVVDRLRGCGVAVHTASDSRLWARPGELERTNVEGTRTVLAAAAQAGVARFVHLSSDAVLADGSALRHVDETAPYPVRPAGENARTKALAEQLVLAANSRQMRTVAVRPRLVWGPGDTTVLPAILQSAEDGRWAWVAGGSALTSTCHVDNLCEGLECAAERGRGGQTYFVTDGPPVEFRWFVTRAAAAHGRTLTERTVPYRVARTAAVALDRGWRVLHLKGQPPINEVAVDLGGQEATVNDELARRELRYAPLVSVEEGLADLAESVAAGGRARG